MADAATSDKFAQVRGFTVEITDPATGATETDNTWEKCSGGGLTIEFIDSTIGSDKQHGATPGHKTVEEITLRGTLTDQRTAMVRWLNDTMSGKPWRRTLTITELITIDGGVKPGKKYTYFECFPVGYVFPRMTVTHTTGNVHEEVRIKPVRCELK